MSLLINLFLFEPLVLSCYWHLWLSEQKAQVLSQSFVRWLPLVLTSGLLCAPSMEWKSAALQKGSSRGTIEIMEFEAPQPHVILIKKKIYIYTAFMINLEINKEDEKNTKKVCPLALGQLLPSQAWAVRRQDLHSEMSYINRTLKNGVACLTTVITASHCHYMDFQ